MIKFWKSLTYATKFSAIAFVLTVFIGLFSMGFLGLGLYYLVGFLFQAYPNLNDWTGDWVWAALIGAGMFWSIGFVIAGFVWHYFHKKIKSLAVLRIIYILILWLWAAFVWFLFIYNKLDPLG